MALLFLKSRIGPLLSVVFGGLVSAIPILFTWQAYDHLVVRIDVVSKLDEMTRWRLKSLTHGRVMSAYSLQGEQIIVAPDVSGEVIDLLRESGYLDEAIQRNDVR